MDSGGFSEYLSQITNGGFVTMGIGIGHELGLFELMMTQTHALTSSELANKAGMKERYVREWLGAMVTARIVYLDPASETYSIPTAFQESIKGAAPMCTAVFAFSRRKDDVKRCFMKDGPYGFDFDHDDDFWSWFSGYRSGSADSFINQMVDQIKTSGFVEKLEKGIQVLDIGCGSAELTIEYAKTFPNSTFIGLDFFDKALDIAREKANAAMVSNLTFLKANCHKLPDTLYGQFDMITVIDTLHDLPDPTSTLREIEKALKPDGLLSIEELGPDSNVYNNIGNKMAPLFYVASMFVCLPSGLSEEPRAGHGACWGKDKMLREIADIFTIKSVHDLPSSNIHIICSKQQVE